MSTNEPIASHRSIKSGSNRSFGLVFSSFFAIVAVAPAFSGGTMRVWAIVVAFCFLTVALFAPKWLGRLNSLWFRFALLLNRFITPVVMGLLYAILFVPTGLILKAQGKDFLRLKWQPDAGTYWIERPPPAPEPKSMTRQF